MGCWKFSTLDIITNSRRITAAANAGSRKLVWVMARINGPSGGTFSRPTTSNFRRILARARTAELDKRRVHILHHLITPRHIHPDTPGAAARRCDT